MNRCLIGLLLILAVAACDPNDETPLPTRINLDGTATAVALQPTATRRIPIVATSTNTPPPTLTFTPSRTTTLTPTLTWTPPPAQPDPITFTPSPPPSETPIPTLTPTRAYNPDAVVGEGGAELFNASRPDAEIIGTLAPLTPLEVQASNEDQSYLQVQVGSDLGSAWVAAEDVVIFGQVALYNPQVGVNDLQQPQVVSTELAGTGFTILPYAFFNCGDTYWTGDGNGFSMESLTYQGRYPRFARIPIRVYVHGLPENGREQWELAISEAFAQLSQAVALERVFLEDLEFFQPTIPLETMLADTRVDMIWHLIDAEAYPQSAPCPDQDGCSSYHFAGPVVGGPLRFLGVTYIPENTPRKSATLLHTAIHALGLWVHSPSQDDLMHADPLVLRMSPRDVNTLRCLYNAPLYGDGNVP